MGNVTARHRPLIGGIKFSAGRLRNDGTIEDDTGGGTLTGVARDRDTNQRVLVGNRHSFLVGSPTDDYAGSPSGVKMYQPSLTSGDEVGTVLRSEPVNRPGRNGVDIAICSLKQGETADYVVHGHPHGSRKIVAGPVTPDVGDDLLVLGARSGEVTLRVAAVWETTPIRKFEADPGYQFVNLIKFTWDNTLTAPRLNLGDSGSPCVVPVPGRPGLYKMAAIVFSVNEGSREAWAFLASAAESWMRITFGKTAPTANAGYSSDSPRRVANRAGRRPKQRRGWRGPDLSLGTGAGHWHSAPGHLRRPDRQSGAPRRRLHDLGGAVQPVRDRTGVQAHGDGYFWPDRHRHCDGHGRGHTGGLARRMDAIADYHGHWRRPPATDVQGFQLQQHQDRVASRSRHDHHHYAAHAGAHHYAAHTGAHHYAAHAGTHHYAAHAGAHHYAAHAGAHHYATHAGAHHYATHAGAHRDRGALAGGLDAHRGVQRLWTDPGEGVSSGVQPGQHAVRVAPGTRHDRRGRTRAARLHQRHRRPAPGTHDRASHAVTAHAGATHNAATRRRRRPTGRLRHCPTTDYRANDRPADNGAAHDEATDKAAHNQATDDKAAHDKATHHEAAHNQAAYNQAAHNQAAYNQAAYNQAAYNQAAHNKAAHNQAAHNQAAHNQAAYDKATHDKAAYNKAAHAGAAAQQDTAG